MSRGKEIRGYFFSAKNGWFSTTVSIPKEGATMEKALEKLFSEEWLGDSLKNPDDWELRGTWDDFEWKRDLKFGEGGCPACNCITISKLFGDAWSCDNCGAILKR